MMTLSIDMLDVVKDFYFEVRLSFICYMKNIRDAAMQIRE